MRFLNLKFLHGLAAVMIGTSNSPHLLAVFVPAGELQIMFDAAFWYIQPLFIKEYGCEDKVNYRKIILDKTFTVVLEPEEGTGFIVRVPAFPEIVTYGEDEQEALAMAEDAIRLAIKESAARGE